MKYYKEIYQINLPNYTNEMRFNFQSDFPEGSITLSFWYFNSRWNLDVTFPSGEVRSAAIFQNVMHWKNFTDYALGVYSPVQTIGYDDLRNTELYLILWQ